MPSAHSPSAPRLKSRVRLAVVVFCSFGFAVSMLATTVLRASLEELRDSSETIVIGTVRSTSNGAMLGGRIRSREYQVAVTEVLRGAKTTSTVLRYPEIAGAPQLIVGKRYIFFVRGGASRSTVGMQQGLFTIQTVAVDDRQTTLVVSGDGEPLVIGKDGQLRRGAPVEIRQGRMVAAASGTASGREMPDMPTSAENVSPVTSTHTVIEAEKAVRRFATLDDLRRFVKKGAR